MDLDNYFKEKKLKFFSFSLFMEKLKYLAYQILLIMRLLLFMFAKK